MEYNTESKEYECIAQMQELTEQINISLKSVGKEEITVYQLDRMIWLVCTGYFFLDTKRSSKQRYIDQIQEFPALRSATLTAING